ncbi:MAG: tetratricopeptide repeat protein [Desulfobacula sp.]
MRSRVLFLLAGLFSLLLTKDCLCEDKKILISSDMQAGYADTLFKDKDYEAAVIEYKRFIHFFPESERLDQVKFRIAVCLFEQKKYMDAAKAFNDIILETPDAPDTGEAYFYQAEAFMNLGNMGYAEIVLQNYLKLTGDLKTKDRIYAELARLHLVQARASKPDSLTLAKEYLLKISPSNAPAFNTENNMNLILAAEKAPKKNPGAAGFFSIIPGGGFLYCERYQDALVTFLLNTGLMLAAYEAYDNDNKALAGVIGFVETGFYMGNIYGAVSSAHKYNQAGVLKILNRDISLAPKIDPEGKGLAMTFYFDF